MGFAKMEEIKEIPVADIKVGEYEQRIETDDESIVGLAASIGRVGLLYPIIVRPESDGYLLVEGHRRLAACRRLGHKTVRCDITHYAKDDEAEIAFAGNFFRKQLSPVELACAMKDCMDNEAMTVEELASGFHRSVHWVQSMMAIADWPGDVQEAIHSDRLSVSAASNLACVTDDSYRSFLVRNAVEAGATARTTASWLQAWRAMQPAEEAITSEPVEGTRQQAPIIPQAPCLCCSQIFPVDRMSHVPMCGECIKMIRQAGSTTV